MIEKKQCTKCNKIKPLDEYYAKENGEHSYCKICHSKYVTENRNGRAAVRRNSNPMNKLKDTMNQKGIKGAWIAEQIGRSKGAFHAWCRNETQPTIEMLFKIANALNVKPSALINDDYIEVFDPYEDKNILEEAYLRYPVQFKEDSKDDRNLPRRINWIEGYKAALEAVKI